MNRLSLKKRTQILKCLVEGNSIRATARICDVVKNTVIKLLVEVGGYKLVELPEAGWCCGGAGSYNLTHPQTSQAILARKLARIEETGADVVATACPACIIQLDSGCRTATTRRPVKHIAELLAQGQGIEAGLSDSG